MSRFRQLTLLAPMDSARLAVRFPRTALHILSDSVAGSGATSFPRRLGLFLTDRCNFACPMCAVQDARNEGLTRGGDLPFELLEKVLAERNVLAAITTNGLKLKDNAEDLVRAELPLLQVSLDGWDEPSQTARGLVKGSFDRLREGVRAVQQAKGKRPFPIIRVLTAITRVNHAHLDRIQCGAQDCYGCDGDGDGIGCGSAQRG